MNSFISNNYLPDVAVACSNRYPQLLGNEKLCLETGGADLGKGKTSPRLAILSNTARPAPARRVLSKMAATKANTRFSRRRKTPTPTGRLVPFNLKHTIALASTFILSNLDAST